MTFSLNTIISSPLQRLSRLSHIPLFTCDTLSLPLSLRFSFVLSLRSPLLLQIQSFPNYNINYNLLIPTFCVCHLVTKMHNSLLSFLFSLSCHSFFSMLFLSLSLIFFKKLKNKIYIYTNLADFHNYYYYYYGWICGGGDLKQGRVGLISSRNIHNLYFCSLFSLPVST